MALFYSQAQRHNDKYYYSENIVIMLCVALYLVINPTLFFKKAKGLLQSPPSVRLSDMLSPPKPLDEIQPNLVCELIT